MCPKDSDESNGDTRIRDMPQIGMYLPENLVDELNEAFRKFNAHRAMDDLPDIEKNKDFYPALIRCALDNNWESYVEEQIK